MTLFLVLKALNFMFSLRLFGSFIKFSSSVCKSSKLDRLKADSLLIIECWRSNKGDRGRCWEQLRSYGNNKGISRRFLYFKMSLTIGVILENVSFSIIKVTKFPTIGVRNPSNVRFHWLTYMTSQKHTLPTISTNNVRFSCLSPCFKTTNITFNRPLNPNIQDYRLPVSDSTTTFSLLKLDRFCFAS
jgi:hypothetical protein